MLIHTVFRYLVQFCISTGSYKILITCSQSLARENYHNAVPNAVTVSAVHQRAATDHLVLGR